MIGICPIAMLEWASRLEEDSPVQSATIDDMTDGIGGNASLAAALPDGSPAVQKVGLAADGYREAKEQG